MTIDIYSLDLERYLLAGILRFPETFSDIDGIISESDFVNNMHKTIFGIIRQTLRSQEKIEPALIAEKINNLSLSFQDKISNVFDYLVNLKLIQIQAKGVKDIALELSLVTTRREIAETCVNIADEMRKSGDKKNRSELVSWADNLYNARVSIWDNGLNVPQNICDDIYSKLEYLGDNPIDNPGVMGPHLLSNKLYGSLFREGNISVVCARAKAGKTTFLLDYAYKTSKLNNNIPCLYFDVGEMSSLELQMRLASSLSGVPMYYLETGKFKQDADMYNAVRKIKTELDNRNIFYMNVANKSVDEMLTILRRFYLSKVGRGNKMLFVKDYLKSFSEKSSNNKQEWETFGIMINKFKETLSTEVPVGMLTASQSNRTGIVTGKRSDELGDSEDQVGGSDRIVMYSSQVFLLRKKTDDEILREGGKWGTHKFIPLVTRHLGENVNRAVNLVKTPDGKLARNYINFDIRHFQVKEMMDFAEVARSLQRMNIENTASSVSL